MPGSPAVRTAKSSCFGKISTRIGPFGVNWYFADRVFSASCASGIAYSRSTGASAGIQLEDDVAFADLDELVERVEQRQQVVGDQVVRVDLEGTVERQTRLRLVAGPHQVHAELGMRPRVRRVERHRFAREADGLVEAVVPRGELATRPGKSPRTPD